MKELTREQIGDLQKYLCIRHLKDGTYKMLCKMALRYLDCKEDAEIYEWCARRCHLIGIHYPLNSDKRSVAMDCKYAIRAEAAKQQEQINAEGRVVGRVNHCNRHGGYGFVSDCVDCHPELRSSPSTEGNERPAPSAPDKPAMTDDANTLLRAARQHIDLGRHEMEAGVPCYTCDLLARIDAHLADNPLPPLPKKEK